MADAKFRYLPHTADVEFEAYGKSLKEAIENAVLALLNVALDLKKISSCKGKPSAAGISEEAGTVENLVWFVLQDVISERSARYLNAYRFRVDMLKTSKSGFALRGRLLYKEMKGDYTLLDVKAVTPHDLAVRNGREGYSITVTIDV